MEKVSEMIATERARKNKRHANETNGKLTAAQNQTELAFRLSNPNYTIYHRAALGGLAATVRAWQENEKLKPEGIAADFDEGEVRLSWSGISDREALRRILDASFKLTPDGKGKQGGKLIDLPAHGIEHREDGLRLAVHNGLFWTFLQHNRIRNAEKDLRHMSLKSVDAEEDEVFTYKGLDNYAHQIAEEKLNLLDAHGKLAEKAEIPQWIVPGAMRGAVGLEASVQDVFLLLYLMIGCAVYHLRPRKYKEKAQFCVVVPDVINLKAFAKALRRLAGSSKDFKQFTRNYLNRVVGGAEEAALSFLIDLEASNVARERHGVAGCLAIAMGRVAWDKQQNNRSQIFKIGGEYDELEVFKTARQYLSQPRTVKLKTGESFVFPASPVPELIAANLAARHHWCSDFKELVTDKKDFQNMLFARKGLAAMKDKLRDRDDQTIIRTFHKAWEMTQGALGKRAAREGLDFWRLVEVESERMRNAILRAKTSDALASWFLRFCADATKGGTLPVLRDAEETRRVREFIFNARNFERFQNLCLFALVSYAGKGDKGGKDGKGKTIENQTNTKGEA